jgi:hypothetical protein
MHLPQPQREALIPSALAVSPMKRRRNLRLRGRDNQKPRARGRVALEQLLSSGKSVEAPTPD